MKKSTKLAIAAAASKPIKRRRKKYDVSAKETASLEGLDHDFTLYSLTELFALYLNYHENDSNVYSEQVTTGSGKDVKTVMRPLSRFKGLRRLEAMRLGKRPFPEGTVSATRPNQNPGYLEMFLSYLVLPFKQLLTDNVTVKVKVDKQLYIVDKLSEKEQETVMLEAKNNPNIISSAEVSDDVSDYYSQILKMSKKMRECFNVLPRRVVQDGVMFFVHSDVSWEAEPVNAIDCVTEPYCTTDPETWNAFFVIRKMTAAEIVAKIKKPGPFWNSNALRWALENAQADRGILNNNHGSTIDHNEDSAACGENFSIRSFYGEKSARVQNLHSYYGNILVVEGHYLNKEGKVDKVIFYPSADFINQSSEEKSLRKNWRESDLNDEQKQHYEDLEKADSLFYRKNVFDSMEEAVTVFPFDRAEPSLERQRGYGHSLFGIVEMLCRIDSAIANFTQLLSTPFYRNRNQGNDGESLEDLEIDLGEAMTNLSDRDFIEVPSIKGNLNDLLAVRGTMLQYAQSKVFLSGLDNTEQAAEGRGGQLANLRLIRDGRIHKHTAIDFADGLRDLYMKMFRRILDLKKKDLTGDDIILDKLFFSQVERYHGKDILSYENSDILPQTRLPYWMSIEAVRSPGSAFGAAELTLLSEIKALFGDTLDQKGLNAFNRIGIKSLLDAQQAIEILGDPREQSSTDDEQTYNAFLENASILGSVDAQAVNFESLPVKAAKDDHMAHLAVHNKKANEIIQKLQENEVTPEALQAMSENLLETRNNLILKLGALANHISQHQANLARFGDKRRDVNQLKEETNAIMQSAEGLMNSLQINLRILDQKQQETDAKLQNLSPENQVEIEKQKTAQQQDQTKAVEAKEKLMLANKIADQARDFHMDQQLTKARDRASKEAIAMQQAKLKSEEIRLKANESKDKKGPKQVSGD